MNPQNGPSPEEILGGSPISPLIADLREAYQHLHAANERLQEWRERRERRERERRGGPGEPPAAGGFHPGQQVP